MKNSYNIEGKFCGYANVFNYKDYYNDIILPTAFSKCLSSVKNVPLLFEHNENMQIGIITFMKEDEIGLYVEGIIDTKNKLYENVKNNQILGLSIGYYATKFDFDKNNNRILKEINLKEISLVLNPANKLSYIKYCK